MRARRRVIVGAFFFDDPFAPTAGRVRATSRGDACAEARWHLAQVRLRGGGAQNSHHDDSLAVVERHSAVEHVSLRFTGECQSLVKAQK